MPVLPAIARATLALSLCGATAASAQTLPRFPDGNPGIVRVFGEIHPHMRAFILVFAHRSFDVTDDEGRFRIANVPFGTCTLVAWNESVPHTARRVVVPDTGAGVEVDFVLERR